MEGFEGRKFFAREPMSFFSPPKAAIFTAGGASPRLLNFIFLNFFSLICG